MPKQFAQDEVSRAALESFRARHHPAPGELDAGTFVRVARLDGATEYLLVPIFGQDGLRGIVQLDLLLAPESSAAIRDPRSFFLIDAHEALTAARAAHPQRQRWGTPFLGWCPSRESGNSLRPLWVIPHAEGNAYVTQEGRVFDSLAEGRGG